MSVLVSRMLKIVSFTQLAFHIAGSLLPLAYCWKALWAREKLMHTSLTMEQNVFKEK